MTGNTRARMFESIEGIVVRRQPATMSRREVARLMGGIGLATAGIAALGRSAGAQQDAASPVSAPQVGAQADGTNLWLVQVGGLDMENGIDLHAFFPGDVTINAGDTIWFEFAPMGMPGFHTVTFTSGEPVPPLFIPDIVDGTPVASPEGPPRLLINPAIAFPDGRSTYDGTGLVNSGLDILRMDQGPYLVTFTAPGTYEYVCAIHSVVMKGTVTVQEAGSSLPNDAAAYEAMAREQFTALVEEGRAAIAELAATPATPATGGTTTWDVAAGAGGLSQARVMRFLPEQLTIKVGDTVRWTNRSVGEPHTVTFLGGEEQPEDAIIEPQEGGPPKLIQNYRTFLPAGEATFDGTGYRNSGFLGLPPEVNEMFGLLGESFELTFTAPGDYPYYCILHAGGPESEGQMIGRITVEA